MNKKLLSELADLAIKIANRYKLNEATAPIPSQSDLDNIEILADDIAKIRTLLGRLYKDVAADKKETENPSVYMDAYMKLILTMLPITGALMDAKFLAGALKQGKLPLGGGSEIKLGSSMNAPTKNPPPIPPLPPKITFPSKLPPLPPPPPRNEHFGSSRESGVSRLAETKKIDLRKIIREEVRKVMNNQIKLD
jgi:hypothetical protein